MAVLRSQSAWEAHAATITEEVMEFEAAMTLPDGTHFLTLHVVALRHPATAKAPSAEACRLRPAAAAAPWWSPRAEARSA